jgi:membrane protease subunit HflC
VNTDPSKVRLDAFEDQLRNQIAPRMLEVYGIDIRQVGVERMTLPDETLAATVARMRAEREVVAATRTAEGLKKAAAIRADADREAREVVAEARETAARTEADAQQQAARIYQTAYQSDPDLYDTLRSLDTISQVVSRNTTVVLRTDAAPFRVLVDGPSGIDDLIPKAAPKGSRTSSQAASKKEQVAGRPGLTKPDEVRPSVLSGGDALADPSYSSKGPGTAPR